MKNELYESPEVLKEERSGALLAGGFFIVMGIIFLIGMTADSFLGFNPWLLAALLPVYWIVAAAYKRYRRDGRITGPVITIFAFGLLPFAYIVAAALGFNVGAIWPVGFIIAGVAFILSGMGR